MPTYHSSVLDADDRTAIAADRPDYVLVLPWNLRKELVEQLSYVREWGGRLVFPIPELSIVEVER